MSQATEWRRRGPSVTLDRSRSSVGLGILMTARLTLNSWRRVVALLLIPVMLAPGCVSMGADGKPERHLVAQIAAAPLVPILAAFDCVVATFLFSPIGMFLGPRFEAGVGYVKEFPLITRLFLALVNSPELDLSTEEGRKSVLRYPGNSTPAPGEARQGEFLSHAVGDAAREAILRVDPVKGAASLAIGVGLTTVFMPTGPTAAQRHDPRWTARSRRLRREAILRRRRALGPGHWALKNESVAPLRVTYSARRALKSTTLGPGEEFSLEVGKSGVNYTLRQGKRKKKGTATPRRGQTVTTVWE